MKTNQPTWGQKLWRMWLFSLCVGLLFAAIQSGCQADNSGKDGSSDATTQDTASQDKTSQDTTTQETARESGGVLPKGSKCQPGDTCESGYLCCATCCGTPPPPDSGPRDPGYTCIAVDTQTNMCPVIP